ncbi:phage tail tape measure protein [Mahella australiensis]|uniref:Phage tail tape measure protein, TP901 family n=1 Tax=Mahella australiensis (strain DSM 15567 / CIP 107919 / 50-1 BON) TaxID=697281 RepID=F4A0G3_MAHA5|nr:phage tail tape measure protein [Mahella australiensis]AEE98024.1 phage tail tape measure protein, TP901 family [Mahella australiensis 50-1 BON]
MAEVGNLQVRLSLKMDEFTKGMQDVAKQMDETEKKFSGFQKVGQKLTDVGKSMTMGITLPIGLAAGASIKAAADFETMGNTFKAVSGATSEQFQQMSELAKQLGNDITLPGTSATDAAAAMTELVKAGVSIDDTFKAAKATLQLSAAAQIDNAEAATIVGQALNSFNLSGDQASTVADLLANSANASAGEITDMAYALQAGGSVASMAGQSIQDFTTAISLMANAGITGSDAGTSLKSMLMALMSPTDAAAKTMQQLGINIYDASGKMLPLPRIVEQFSTKLSGMTEQQRNAALATIFGSDAVRAANTVLMAGSDQWDQMSDAVNKAGGAQEVAGAKMQGTNGAIESLKSTLETLAITIGENLLPAITPLIEKLTDLVNWFGNLPPGVQQTIIAIAGIAAAICPVILVAGQLMTAFSSLSGLMPILSAAFGLLTGPVGIVIAVIAAAIAIGVLLYKNWDEISAWLGKVWNGIKEVATTVWNAIKDFFSNTWNGIKSIASTVWEGIKTVILTPINALKNLLSTVWNAIKNTASNLWNGLKNTASTVWEGIKNVIMTPINSIKDLLSGVWNGITSTASEAWNGLRKAASDIFGKVKDAILSPFRNLHIPLPHFSFSIKHTKIAGINVPYPDVDVNWYKEGAIFTSPSIIGVGEAGAEAVVPLDQLTGIVRDALKQVGGVTNHQNAPLLYIENMSVRNDQDIDKLSQAIYNQNMRVMRAMGRKSI